MEKIPNFSINIQPTKSGRKKGNKGHFKNQKEVKNGKMKIPMATLADSDTRQMVSACQKSQVE